MKRKNYYQVHKNKKPKVKIPPIRPTKQQLEQCFELFRNMNEASRLANYAIGNILESITGFKAIYY